jgi:cystathionine beta-lyase
MEYDTLAVHPRPAAVDGASGVVAPLATATTFVQPGASLPFQRYAYARGSNPTGAELEHLVADLEGARHAFAFASGMAASSAAFALIPAGKTVLLTPDVYGGTFRYADRLFADRGLAHRLVTDAAGLGPDAFGPEDAAVFLETPSNPLLRVTDIRRLADAAHAAGLLVIVDNTLMTSYLQRPLELGADIVVYSATKFYGGHSDIVGGLAVVDDDALAERLALVRNTLGNVMSPRDAHLLTRSIKTLALRMDRHQAGVRAVLDVLLDHPAVAAVHYPTLGEPGRSIHRAQARGGGGVLSLELGPDASPHAFVDALRLFSLAVSLGAVESLVCLPATMTHESYPPELRQTLGIADGLIRLSVGIENPADLAADVAQALAAARRAGASPLAPHLTEGALLP